MSVYADDRLKLAAVRNGTRTVRGRWSHLMADSSDELHLFAATLGLKPAWVQRPATVLEHYDITAGKRALALQLGAVPITNGEGAHLTRCKRAGIPFDISLLRSDPDRFNAELVRARAALGGPSSSRHSSRSTPPTRPHPPDQTHSLLGEAGATSAPASSRSPGTTPPRPGSSVDRGQFVRSTDLASGES